VDRIDFLAFEPQFVDHAAPVWHATPEHVRGRFLVDNRLVARAASLGVAAEGVDAFQTRAGQRRPSARPGPGPTAFVVSIGDTLVGRRLGYTRFVFMEHGAGQAYTDRVELNRHPSYAGGKDREDAIAFLVPNEYAARLWRRAYPSARVEVIGCPKLDTLPARRPDPGPVVAISFHWPAFGCPEAGTAFGYYRDALPALRRAFTTIGHAHPKADWGHRMERRYQEAGIAFVADFDEVCRQADVYVCDNSSTLFEFAATGRPVVVLNSPEYRRNVNHGLRFWDASRVGVNVERGSDLVDGVSRALADGQDDRDAREHALGIVYAHRSGAAARAARVIEEMMA
jgi:hypothetical protein